MKKISTTLLANIVESRRKAFHMTQAALAAQTGINRSLLSRLEQNLYLPSIPQLEQLPEDYQQLLSQMLIKQSDTLKTMSGCHIIFSRKGYDNFVQNGIIEQISTSLYHPLSVKNRILILNRMLQATLSNTFCFFMISEESFHPKMEIITYDNHHMLLDYHNYDAHKIQTCMITEPNMVITFTDFIQNLANYHFVYTQDETAEMLQNSIHKLKEALPPPIEQTFLIFEKKH